MQLSLAPPAEKFIKRLLRFDGGPGSGLRLQVTAGGCSSLAAEFSVENAPKAGDTVIEIGGLKLFLPAESRLLLDGVTIDFADTPTQSGFVFHNPNQKACGRGPSAVTADLSGSLK
jgi:iron-sulfur cluster assembly protein